MSDAISAASTQAIPGDGAKNNHKLTTHIRYVSSSNETPFSMEKHRGGVVDTTPRTKCNRQSEDS